MHVPLHTYVNKNGDDYMSENQTTSPLPTNTERLRAHLTANGLAAELLSAWEAGDPASAQARLFAALMKFYSPEQADNDKAKAE